MTGLKPRPDGTCGDAVVVASRGLYRWTVLVLNPGRGWCTPGGHPEPHDRDARATAERETLEEAGLDLSRAGWSAGTVVRVPDHRFVGGYVDTTVFVVNLGSVVELPRLIPGPGIEAAAWFRARDFDELQREVAKAGGEIYPPLWNLLADALGRFDWGVLA